MDQETKTPLQAHPTIKSDHRSLFFRALQLGQWESMEDADNGRCRRFDRARKCRQQYIHLISCKEINLFFLSYRITWKRFFVKWR